MSLAKWICLIALWQVTNAEPALQGSFPDTTTISVPRSKYVFHYTMTTPSLVSTPALKNIPSTAATILLVTTSSSTVISPTSPQKMSSSNATKPAIRLGGGGIRITAYGTGFVSPSRTDVMDSTTALTVTDPVTTMSELKHDMITVAAVTNSTFVIRFDGNCSVLELHDKYKEKFKSEVENQIMKSLAINESRIYVENIACGSVNVTVKIYDTHNTNITENLQNLIYSGSLTVIIDTGDNNTFEYTATELLSVMSTGANIQEPSLTMQVMKDSKSLGYIEKIVIIVVCIVAGACLFFGIVVCFYECRRKKYSKSFNLGHAAGLDTMQDFTLTKMRRPQPVYSENGVILSTHFVDFTNDPKLDNRTTLDHLHHEATHSRVTNGHIAPFPGSSAMPDFDEDIVKRTSTENLVKVGKRPVSPGYDNPSFSSDDILDSGTEADATEDLQNDDVASQDNTDAKCQACNAESPLAGPSGLRNRDSPDRGSASSQASSVAPPGASSVASSDSGVPAPSEVDTHSRSPSNRQDSDGDTSQSEILPHREEKANDIKNRPTVIEEESASSVFTSKSNSTLDTKSEQNGLDMLDAATHEYSEKEVALDLSDESRDIYFP